MVSFTVRMRFTDEDHEKVEGLLRVLTEESRKEPGCVSYIAHFVEGNPELVLIYEQYAHQAALEAHRATDHFKQHAIGGLYQLMKDREVENLVAVS